MHPSKRILHVHDQAGVANRLKSISRGLPWRQTIFPPPPIWTERIGSLSYIWNMTSWALALHISRNRNYLLHVHGGHLTPLLSRIEESFILHLHGSDVRSISSEGISQTNFTSDTAQAILRADLVIYSTPDLYPHIKALRPDAIWLPNPVLSERLKEIGGQARLNKKPKMDVFFPHAWSDAKGARRVMMLSEAIRKSMPFQVQFYGVRMGALAGEAEASGFKLLNPVNERTHIQRMKSARVVLGQGSGLLGVTDIQAILSGNNFLPFPLETETLAAYGYTNSEQPTTSEDQMLSRISEVFRSKNPVSSDSRLDSVIGMHQDKNVARVLSAAYEGMS